MRTFFITGQPRSRTAWLANLFTYRDSFCFHEALKQCETAREMRRLFRSRKVRFVGDSDSGLPFFMEEVMAEFPDARLVVVERETGSVIRSLEETFSGQAGVDYEEMVLKTEEVLERLKADYKPLIVRYEDLTRMEVCRNLWDYCVPGLPFDEERWKMLDILKIEIIPAKYLASIPPETAFRITERLKKFW